MHAPPSALSSVVDRLLTGNHHASRFVLNSAGVRPSRTQVSAHERLGGSCTRRIDDVGHEGHQPSPEPARRGEALRECLVKRRRSFSTGTSSVGVLRSDITAPFRQPAGGKSGDWTYTAVGQSPKRGKPKDANLQGLSNNEV